MYKLYLTIKNRTKKRKFLPKKMNILFIICVTSRSHVKFVYSVRILRRIFEPKRDENGEWKKLHNKNLHSLYRSPTRHIVRMEEGKISFKVLTDKHTGMRPLGRPRRRWKDTTRMDLK